MAICPPRLLVSPEERLPAEQPTSVEVALSLGGAR
jgi:hypothetical protein